MDRAPKVFISYSWKSEEYKEEVLHLAERLRGDGVDVILDRWHLKPGHNMLYFMENSVRVADKVLILCESSYVEKANSRKGGAGKETRIISPTVYEENLQEKFIPVFMESHKIVPDYLKDTYGISYQNQTDEEYKKLLDAVRGEVDDIVTEAQTDTSTPSGEKQPEQDVELPPLSADAEEETVLPTPLPMYEEEPIFPDDEAFERFLHSDNTKQTETASEPLSDPMPAPVKDFDFEPTPEGVILTKYRGEGGKVRIPGEINGQSVIKIAKEAFDYCETLRSVTIPDTVTAIGTRAFNHCTGLISVTLPANLTRIGNSAFCECSSLKYIYIPSRAESIGQFAFEKCTALEAVTIPVSVTHIYSHAFSGTTLKIVYYDGSKSQWASIVIERGNETLTHAKREYDITEQFSPVEDFIAYVTSADGVKIWRYIGSSGKVVIPNEISGAPVTTIGYEAFLYCEKLTSIVLSDSVTSIESNAFKDCVGLTAVLIPDNVTNIGYSAFKGCTGLTSVTIPDSVKSIEGGVFSDCTGLTSVMIPNGVTSIGNFAFSGCTGLTSVIIPDSVTSIGDYAFSDCTGLTSVTIPDSVTSIGRNVFSNCTSLTSVTIPDSVTSIGDYAFSNCTSLTSITISNSVTSIGEYAFWKCTGLTSVTIPDSVTSVGDSAFSGCTSLSSITIPDSVTSIEGWAFYDCNKLRTVYYSASKRQWNGIKIGGANESLKYATILFARKDKHWWEALI